MNEHKKANLVQLLRQMISVIEQDGDFIGPFFEEGVNQIRIKRITTSENEITQIHTYGFDLSQDAHGSLCLDTAWKKEDIVNDRIHNGPIGAPSNFPMNNTLNQPISQRISETRTIDLSQFKQNGDKDE